MDPDSPVFRFFERVGYVFGKVIKISIMILLARTLKKSVTPLLPTKDLPTVPREIDVTPEPPNDMGN